MNDHAPDTSLDYFIDMVALIGGDESNVFLDLMLNMYRLWAYESYLAFRVVDPVVGAGARLPGRVKLLIEAADREMLASRENGVHRMIRIPPGRTQRHMSFVGVRVSGRADTPLPTEQAGWGEQIRTLLINPEAALTNHRSGYVCKDVVGVMYGNLQKFWEETA